MWLLVWCNIKCWCIEKLCRIPQKTFSFSIWKLMYFIGSDKRFHMVPSTNSETNHWSRMFCGESGYVYACFVVFLCCQILPCCMPSLSDDGRMSVSGVRPLLVGPYVLEFVCDDMKGLQVNANSSLCRANGCAACVAAAVGWYVWCQGRVESHRGLSG